MSEHLKALKHYNQIQSPKFTGAKTFSPENIKRNFENNNVNRKNFENFDNFEISNKISQNLHGKEEIIQEQSEENSHNSPVFNVFDEQERIIESSHKFKIRNNRNQVAARHRSIDELKSSGDNNSDFSSSPPCTTESLENSRSVSREFSSNSKSDWRSETGRRRSSQINNLKSRLVLGVPQVFRPSQNCPF